MKYKTLIRFLFAFVRFPKPNEQTKDLEAEFRHKPFEKLFDFVY